MTKITVSSVGVLPWLLNLELLLIAIIVVWRLRNRDGSVARAFVVATDSVKTWLNDNKGELLIVCSLFICLGLYFHWVGPYTEVPADFWAHIGSTQRIYLSLVDEQLFSPITQWWVLGGKQAEYWYSIQAFFCYMAGISVEQSVGFQATTNSLIIQLAVFVFTLMVLRGSDLSKRSRYVVAAIATLFFLATFGTSVFSFVRYYTFGPAFFNYITFLVFTVLVLDFLGTSAYRKLVYPPLLFLLLVLMGVVHFQEAAFALILGSAILFYVWLRVSILDLEKLEGCAPGPYRLNVRQLDAIFYVTFFSVVAFVITVHFNFTRHDVFDFNRMISLEEVLPFTHHMYILDPQQQFYETLTPWGYLVLLLFVLNWRRFAVNPILVAGMLSPFYTVFNPVFTDFFLRFSWPELVWRFLYMTPTYIVAALLVYQCGSFLSNKTHAVKIGYGLTVISMLVVLLFPLDTTYFYSPYSKYQTLKKVSAGNDHRVWKDLYTYLRDLDNKYKVLTDPITGYTLRALTQHIYSGPKFHRLTNVGYKEFNFKEYSLDKYEKYNGWLFVINQRDGSFSETGDISHHWGDNQLQLHRYYRGGLVEFVKANPSVFKELWVQDGISVFRIGFDGKSKENT